MATDPLADLRNMAPEPKFGENQEKERQDIVFKEEQKNATPEKTQEAMEEAKNSLGYGNFNKSDFIQKDPYYEEGDKPIEEAKNNNNFPENKENIIISGYLEAKKIDISGLGLSFNKNGVIDIDSIFLLNENETIDLKNFLKKSLETNTDKNISNFSKLINENEISELGDFDKKLYSDGKFEESILNIIGEDFIEIPGKNPSENISTAIKLKRNTIEKEVQNLKTDTQTYKTAISNIESGNLKKQIEGIRSLHALAYSGEGKYGKKDFEKYKKKRKEKLEAEHEKLKQEYLDLSKSIINKEDLVKETERIQNEYKTLKEEYKELDDGDIFKASNLDKNNDNIEKETQN